MRSLTGERRAVAALVFTFYGFIYLLNALLGPGQLEMMFYGMAAVYGLAFFGLVAGYFWARWYAMGVALCGVIQGVFSLWMAWRDPALVDAIPILLFFFGTHAVAALLLWGRSMSALFDGRKDWRERFHIDDVASERLRKSIVRAGVSLPMIVMYALGPKDGAMAEVLGFAAAGLAFTGVWGLVKMRTWGLLALLGAAGATVGSALASGVFGLGAVGTAGVVTVSTGGVAFAAVAVIAALAAVAPFVKDSARFLKA